MEMEEQECAMSKLGHRLSSREALPSSSQRSQRMERVLRPRAADRVPDLSFQPEPSLRLVAAVKARDPLGSAEVARERKAQDEVGKARRAEAAVASGGTRSSRQCPGNNTRSSRSRSPRKAKGPSSRSGQAERAEPKAAGLLRRQPSLRLGKTVKQPKPRSDATTSESEFEKAIEMAEKGEGLKGRLSRRTLRRVRRYHEWRSELTAATFLEHAAVGEATARSYAVALSRLEEEGAQGRPLLDVADRDLDDLVTRHMNDLFLAGEKSHLGARLLAAVQHVTQKGRLLIRAARAAQGWRRVDPPRARDPVPMAAWAIVMTKLAEIDVRKAQMVALMIAAYLRVSEALRIEGVDVTPPSRELGRDLWSVVVAPRDRGVPTKSREFDDSITLSRETFEWMPSLLERLKRKEPRGRWFPWSYAEFRKDFLTAVKAASLPMEVTIHQARHTGPSLHRLLGTFDLATVQKRGRWRSVKSVQRYEKAAVMLRQESLLKADVLKCGLRCESSLGALLTS